MESKTTWSYHHGEGDRFHRIASFGSRYVDKIIIRHKEDPTPLTGIFISVTEHLFQLATTTVAAIQPT